MIRKEQKYISEKEILSMYPVKIRKAIKCYYSRVIDMFPHLCSPVKTSLDYSGLCCDHSISQAIRNERYIG